ncbi:MAG: DNA protecting protein DprA [Lentisphaerae bacterium RIFOXYA12_FULL_48_11]|nr:MAG: DNA protecting protein DprA [Lentisphaerae bacterium RIFOXYA12_FULL_48_11]
MNEREAYIALNMMEKVGPVTVRAMVAGFGSAAAIFDAGKDELLRIQGIGSECAGAILNQKGELDWQGEQVKAAAIGAHIVTQIDAEYPKQLLSIHDPPLALYVQGELENRDSHSIAIVGTRHATHYGLQSAEKLAFQLATCGFTVVSGLAEGIDTMAHRAALKAKGRTIAVIGSGLDCLYPMSNKQLAQEITGCGAVISEFPMGRKPDKTTFPIRNRIVSGLSKGVIVVEAGVKSGSLITVNQAMEQGRSVFAVPGRIDSPASQGCLKLIKDGAKLVTGVDDVIAEYEFLIPPGSLRKPEVVSMPVLSSEEICLTELLSAGEQDVDSLIRRSGMKAQTVNSLLVGLEMKRIIRMQPGRMVELINRGSK